jgi:putative lipoic acid-binding regulatory protein
MNDNGVPRGDGHDSGAVLAYPARVHIKAIGNHSSRFEALVHEIVMRHIAPDALVAATTRPSSGGKYLAVTVTIEAESRAQLDEIYQELSRCDDVLIAL